MTLHRELYGLMPLLLASLMRHKLGMHNVPNSALKRCMNTWLNPLKKMRNKCFEGVIKTDTSKLFCLILKLVFCGIS